jgi:glycerol kinase
LHFYPSFDSIFAPYWKSGIQGAFIGLNFNTTKEAILASILEAITFRIYDNIKFKDFDEIQ